MFSRFPVLCGKKHKKDKLFQTKKLALNSLQKRVSRYIFIDYVCTEKEEVSASKSLKNQEEKDKVIKTIGCRSNSEEVLLYIA